LAALVLWNVLSLAAATSPDALPNLRPPKDELPPTFWEEYGLMALVAGVLSLLLLAAVVWLVTRPKPVPAARPETRAREALEPLRGRPEDGVLLSRVSRILRRYLCAAFSLPPEQLTTTEFCDVLATHSRVGPELAAAVADFFKRCDKRKFAPLSPSPDLGAVEDALKLIASAEQQLARQAQPGPSPIPAGEGRPAQG
jgi:hypothetical protein